MTVTVVGSIAFDAVSTPFDSRDRIHGGAAFHFAQAASFFTDVRVVGPVGDDYTDEDVALLATRGTNVDDVERVAGGKTFFWKGHYHEDLNTRDTITTELGVFETFEPKLSAASAEADVLFLANIVPAIQRAVRAQAPAAKWVALDSMNLWIDIARDDLVAAISEVDCLILNDEELAQLTGARTSYAAAQAIFGWPIPEGSRGLSSIICKQGSYGAQLFTKDGGGFTAPVFPLESVVDPTGAGDTFAGGVVGYVAARLAADPSLPVDRDVLATALVYGTATASHNVEGFGGERLFELSGDALRERVGRLESLINFRDVPVELRA
ncbi:PfkB family carbohydrate kinase [Patulibacter brassicae]|jgi:sugar/nucleoside kinase (ribokinase family)|uniref:PfkB family carbohydrate kinase n=1 Tax=Patulibacter brassicae TaxID=1705717 RepID=A0ABU4VJM0_9ACTN|nr:PfkB family carbohydrate kinase [Patulibacter brassicae]MDX8152003.1 PfkB family carbohydrate kinase [Patulibacter brassicae]